MPPLNTAPTLTGFGPTVTFAENTVNTTPLLLDIDVTFDDAEGNFDGGRLTMTGLLAEDTVSVNNQGTGAGDIGLSGSDVTYGGDVIGTLTGGVGADLTITFNAAATSASMDALIRNLTYANASDAPIASRDLVLNVTDALGLGLYGAVSYRPLTGSANPFGSFDVGDNSSPTFGDIDGDGDMDLVVGGWLDGLHLYLNTDGIFTLQTAAASPLTGLTGSAQYVAPSLGDIDNDGDLDLVVGNSSGMVNVWENQGGTYVLLTGAADPLPEIRTGWTNPTFVDLDRDGDMDLVIGDAYGRLAAYDNVGGIYVQLTGGAFPFPAVAAVALDTWNYAVPRFADLDNDGDLDLVVGEYDGVLFAFDNDGGRFTQLTGAANPFSGIDVGNESTPSFVDLDDDGDLDLVIGNRNGNLTTYINETPRGRVITVTVTPENDAPTATGLPTDVIVQVYTASDLDLSAITLTDGDGGDTLTVVLTASTGKMTAASTVDVTVTDSGTAALTLTGTAVDIDAYLNDPAHIQYTAAVDALGDDAATITLTADDGSGAVTLGTVNVDVTTRTTAPTLTGFGPIITFAENAVNAGPQLLDIDVTFDDPEGDFNGGKLRLTGILAEDSVSVNNQGTGAGQIGLNGDDVTYEGAVIGTVSGGVGTDLRITFNAAATSVGIDALIQNLTYANSSDTPTTSRDFVLNVTDASTADLGVNPGTPLSFIPLTGAANPFAGVTGTTASTPGFVDFDGDGDLDLVVGEYFGTLTAYVNDARVFTPLTRADNPFGRIQVISGDTAPRFVDLNGDGDLDLVLGNATGTLLAFDYDPDAKSYTERPIETDPFAGIDVGNRSTPSFVDLDDDGDLDLVVGEYYGTLLSYRNDAGTYIPLTGATNPFDGINVGKRSAPSFADLDGDGDLDLVVGNEAGMLRIFDNTGVGIGGLAVFSELIGTANPFDGINFGLNSTPELFDFDGDGDLDLVVGNRDGTLLAYQNTALHGAVVTIAVTPENEPTTATGLPIDVVVREDSASVLDLSGITLSDVDTTGSITVVLTASSGTMTAFDGPGVAVADSGTSALSLTGTVADIDAYLNRAANLRYTGATDINGHNAATITLTADEGFGATTLGVVNVDITPVNDAPTLIDLDLSVTFAENTVNATPHLLDIDVTFDDAEGNFDGGHLTLTGLLAEDTVAVNHQGTGAGQIGLSGADVTYEGVIIGTMAGGSGADLSIMFNAAADAAAVDALVQNLAYANSSDTPTTRRDFLLNIADASGADLGVDPASTVAYAPLTGAANPFEDFSYLTAGVYNVFESYSSPAFVDFDDDGDLDLVLGQSDGKLHVIKNEAGIYTAPVRSIDPFDAITVRYNSVPAFVDLDGDGVLDLVVGDRYGALRSFRNDGGVYIPLSGAGDPFNGTDFGGSSTPTFADYDGDGDQDLVLGDITGRLQVWQNNGGAFAELADADNPLIDIDVGDLSRPSFTDLDGDGDLDLVVGAYDGTLRVFDNDAGTFTPLTGAANPFDNVIVDRSSAPSFADLDGDGDLDLIVGHYDGPLVVYQNTTPHGIVVAVAVTPENDAPFGTGLPSDLIASELYTDYLDLTGFTLTDPDITDMLTVVFTASSGTMYVGSYAGYTVTNNRTSAVTVTGTAADFNTYLGYLPTGVSYTGVAGIYGDNAATITVTVDDGSGVVALGTVNLDITDEYEIHYATLSGGRLIGTDGRDLMIGAGGRDVLFGFGASDIIIGSDGNDVIRGGAGADTLYGDDGVDWLQYVGSAAGVTVDLHADGAGLQSASGGDAAGDVISGFEFVRGSSHDDVLTGNDDRNVLIGDAGADTIIGQGGHDVIHGGTGADDLSGGDGLDWLQYTRSAAGVTVDLNADGAGLQSASGGDATGDVISGFEYVRGSDHDDMLTGNDDRNILIGDAGADTISGQGGNDVIRGGAGADALSGGDGLDWLQYARSAAGVTIDLHADGAGLQSASGGDATGDVISGFEYVRGSSHDDVLTGNDDRNILIGDAGADTIAGGGGNDVLRGGAGADAFVFNAGLGKGNVDRIVDFSALDDTILLDSSIFTGLSAGGLSSAAFLTNATGLADSADQRIIYDSSTGRLSFDSDGDGAAGATLFGVLNPGLTLTQADFLVF